MISQNNNFKNFIWNAIGLTSYCLVSMVLFIIVKLVNGINESGIFTYSYSICTLFFYISMYYNRTFQIVDNYKINGFNKFLSTRIITSFASIILIVIFSLISHFDSYKILIIFMIMLFKTIDAISDTFYGYFQQKDKLYLVGISYTLKSFIGILLFLITDLLFKSVFLSIVSLIIVNIIIFVLFDVNKFKKMFIDKIQLDLSDTKKIIKSSFSIFIFQIIAIYLANCQKYMITYISSNEIQTIFGILIMPATVLSLVGNYLILPFINKLGNYHQKKDYKNLNKLTIKIVLILFAIGLIIIAITNILGIPLLNLLYQLQLSEYKLDLLIIILSAIFSSASMIFSGVLTIINENRVQVYIYGFTSIIGTVVCYFATQHDIIFGASLSYFISCLLLFILYLLIYKYKLKKYSRLR